MELKVELESSQVGSTVEEIFASLTVDQKQAIAKDLMEKWLLEPREIEMRSIQPDALKYARDRYSSYYDGKTDAVVAQSSDYKEYLQKHKTSRDTMIEEIKLETISYYKQQVNEMLKNDEQTNVIKDEVMKEIRADFPLIIKKALMASIMGILPNMMSDISYNCMNDQILAASINQASNGAVQPNIARRNI